MGWKLKFSIILGIAIIAGALVFSFNPNIFARNKDANKAVDIVATSTIVQNPASKILIVGDVMLGRYVQTLAEERGAGYTFSKIKDFLLSTGFVVGNLEGPIMASKPKTPIGSMVFSFPTSSVDILKDSGFSMVSLANNHTLDFGQAGFEETKINLASADIDFFGSGVGASTSSVGYKTIGGRKFIFVGFNALAPKFSTSSVISLLMNLKDQNSDSKILVFPHWGEEYIFAPSNFQTALAHSLIDSGASVVIGTHPHVVQNIEIYKGRPIFYSLGNFVFDQYFSKDTQEGLSVMAEFGDETNIFNLYPLESVRSQPKLMEELKGADWLGNLSVRSDQTVVLSVASGKIELPAK